MTKADIPALKDLLVRVLACEGIDRALDADVVAALEGGEVTWKQANFTMDSHPAIRRPSTMHRSGFSNEPVPMVTWSVDAALGLALRTLKPDNVIVNLRGQPRCSILLVPDPDLSHRVGGDLEAPVAIVAATLKAHIAELERQVEPEGANP